MTFTIALIAIAAFLAGSAIGVLAILIAGIRSDDRAKNLTGIPPHWHRSGNPPAARSRRPHPRNQPRQRPGRRFPESDLT
jgi:hypothetical protein